MAQGNSQQRLRAGAKGTTPSSQITSTASGANHQAVDTVLYDTAGNPVSSFADVLPASTLPVATNKAVTVSQRDPLPTGANTIGAISNTSFTANAGTNLNTSLLALDSTVAKDATLTGGTQKAIARGGAKGATVAADITSVSVDANTQALHANITNFPATQPISAVSLPLPTGAATSALQTTQDTSINSLLKPASTLAAVTTVGAVTAITNALPTGANTIGAVTNTNLDVALSTRLKPADTLAGVTAVGSITSALPTGANSIGQVTANAGTNLNTSALALSATQTDGTQKAINRGGAKGATAAADVTSTNVDANTQALDVSVKGAITANLGTIAGVATETTLSAVNTKIPSNLTVTATRLLTDGSGVTQPVSGTFFQATQPVSAATLPLPTGASTEATLSALNTKVTAVNTGAVTISAALPTGANTIGAISNTSFIATQATPANLQATVTNLTLTKGTQGATGATVQNLKDAGRNQTNRSEEHTSELQSPC